MSFVVGALVCALREHAIQKAEPWSHSVVSWQPQDICCGKITSLRAALRNEKEAEIDPWNERENGYLAPSWWG